MPDGCGLVWRSALAQARRELTAAGVESADVDARRIVEAASGAGVGELFGRLDEPATALAAAHFWSMLERRCAGEPLQYVVGSWGFRGLDLMVDQRVLIPRPETEIVAGFAIAEASRRARRPDLHSNTTRRLSAGDAAPPQSCAPAAGIGERTGDSRTGRPGGPRGGGASEVVVADLGTGSGAIALSVAVECPEARVYATDLSHDALAVARANLAGIGRAAVRVSLHEGDWYEALPDGLRGSLDVIVSNPPYVARDEALPPLIEDWEPRLALRSGRDGDEALHKIVAGASEWLKPGGGLVLEVASQRAQRSAAVVRDAGFGDIRLESDLAGLDRVVIGERGRGC